MESLLEHIQRIDTVLACVHENQLYLLSALPTAIANKADVSNEFCGGKPDDGFQEAICNPRYIIQLHKISK